VLAGFRVSFDDAYQGLLTPNYFVCVVGSTNVKTRKKRPIEMPATNFDSDNDDRNVIDATRIRSPKAINADCDGVKNALTGFLQRVCSSAVVPEGHSKQNGVGPVRT